MASLGLASNGKNKKRIKIKRALRLSIQLWKCAATSELLQTSFYIKQHANSIQFTVSPYIFRPIYDYLGPDETGAHRTPKKMTKIAIHTSGGPMECWEALVRQLWPREYFFFLMF